MVEAVQLRRSIRLDPLTSITISDKLPQVSLHPMPIKVTLGSLIRLQEPRMTNQGVAMDMMQKMKFKRTRWTNVEPALVE